MYRLDRLENAISPRSSLTDNRMPRLPHADGHQESNQQRAWHENRHGRLHL